MWRMSRCEKNKETGGPRTGIPFLGRAVSCAVVHSLVRRAKAGLLPGRLEANLAETMIVELGDEKIKPWTAAMRCEARIVLFSHQAFGLSAVAPPFRPRTIAEHSHLIASFPYVPRHS